MAKKSRIYFAGKISHGDWRHDIVGSELRDRDANKKWSTQEIEFGSDCLYVGPFFVGCDHGCSHRGGEHGVTEFQCEPNWSGNLHEYDRGCRAPGPDIAGGQSLEYNDRRLELFNKCIEAIDGADFVFAWLDSAEAFGTFWELGYARGRNVRTIVGIPFGLDLSDQWFTVYGAQQVCRAKTAVEAFELNFGVGSKCTSPIEKMFLEALTPLLPGDVHLHAQYELFGCRADFALVGPKSRVVIECDGHEYHERTKDQARRDRSRDRAFQQAGWFIARFTGSEIYADAERCAREAISMLGSS